MRVFYAARVSVCACVCALGLCELYGRQPPFAGVTPRSFSMWKPYAHQTVARNSF